jgi:hypothetical protein
MPRFEWTKRNRQANCLTFVERVEDGEPRWHAIGASQ